MKSLFYPPGGLMVWIFILLELLTFGGTLGAFMIQMASQPELHKSAAAHLDVGLATLNTIVLITSGGLAALGVASYHGGRSKEASRWLFGAASLGLLFCGLKLLEYRDKISAGLEFSTNLFFSYYWALTGFHLLHVAIGIVILLHFALHIRNGKPFADPDVTVETGAAFWHMCDLIWILVFPIIYLSS